MKILPFPIFTILMAFLIVAVSFLPQDAHAMSITVHTDKPLYSYGDTYTISGKVNPVIPNQVVSIVILSPNYPHPSSLSATPNLDGNYSYTLPLAIKDVSSGNFTVIAQYGIAKNQTTFSYNGPPCVPQNDYWYDGVHSAPASNPRIVDSLGNAITGPVKSGQQIQVTSDLANGKNCAQTFAYIVQIEDLNGVTFSLSWITGTLLAGQSLNPAQSWTPTTAGVYTVQIFTWQSLDNPNALAPPLTTTISVEDNASLIQSSHTVSEIPSKLVTGPTTIILNSPLEQLKSGIAANNIKCEQGLQLVIKAENGYPTCITPEHVIRLTQNGWTLSDPFNRIADTDVSTECETKFTLKEFQSGTFSNGTSYTINYVPVFLMKPNSTGKICMNAWSYDKSSVLTIENHVGISKDNSETPDVSVVPYPTNMVIDNTNRTIVYTITTSKEAYGFYRLNTNFNFCGGGFPLAVGYDSSHLFDNDFPWLWETYPCPFNSHQADTQVIGLTGIDVAYIKKEYH